MTRFEEANHIWGISTVGRTNHQLFIPDAEFLGKAVNVRSAQNLAKIFGALAQLVARYIRIVEARGSNPLSSTTICLKTTVFRLFLFIRGVPAVDLLKSRGLSCL